MNRESLTDIVVIGGGIHGAGVAQAAAANGYRCKVLEQSEQLARGTSSRSSKLIHGGLRYLESGQFRLVRECLHERQILLNIAPQLVRLLPFHIPVYEHSHRGHLSIATGLSLYYLLGGGTFQRIPRTQWATLDGIKLQGLKAVFRYQDAQTDDAQLTEAVMASATSLGADVTLGARVDEGERSLDGYRIRYRQNNDSYEIEARCVINASGPWVNKVLDSFSPTLKNLDIDLVAGTHILLPGTLHNGMYYLESPQDKRAVFAMPWQGNTLLGTTEVLYNGNPDDIEPSQEECDYLITVYNHHFNVKRSSKDILSAFAGLRVLPRDTNRPFHRSRETIFHPDDNDSPRLISIYGGKLTAYRATAEAVISLVRAQLPQRTTIADTRLLHL